MLPNSAELVKLLKRAAMDAVEASKPVNVVFGKVTSANPLKINVDQKLTLTTDQLILSRNVTDYTVEVTIDWNTESSSNHKHSVEGKKKMKVHNKLKKDERVILLRQQSGQKFIVLDRVEE